MDTARSRIRFISKMFIAIVMVASVYGCGGGSNSPTTGTVRIINNSGYTLTEAFISPSTVSTWGGRTSLALICQAEVRGISAVYLVALRSMSG